MILGVTYVYAAMNGLASLMAFIITSNFIYLLVAKICFFRYNYPNLFFKNVDNWDRM